MKRLIVFAVIVMLVAILSGCSTPHKLVVTIVDECGTKWNVIQSPITERCYEVASSQTLFLGMAGMSEVPCSEYDEWMRYKE